mmetsp:Transcript_37347/g.72945  ORF Transcript_37347/g.72945 Transcript_37347/m.72945 type:complete len:290 (-) Transcript_37347:863-1732(-)
MRVRVRHKVPQRPDRHEIDLRQKVNLLLWRHGDGTRHERPELANDPKQRRLPTAVGASNQDPFAPLHRKVEVPNQESAIGTVHRHVLKPQILSLFEHGRHPSSRNLLGKHRGAPLKPPHQVRHPARKPRQPPDAVGELEKVLNGRRHSLHVAPCADKVCRYLDRRRRVHPIEPKPHRAGDEYQTDDRDEVLVEILPHTLRVEVEPGALAEVIQQGVEAVVQLLLLRRIPPQERHLLAVGDERRVRPAQLPLQLLLPRSELPKGRQRDRRHARGKRKPAVEGERRREALH